MQVNLFMKSERASIAVKNRLEAYFEQKNIAVSHLFHDDALFTFVIGGDGTFLHAVHSSRFSSVPFVGINTGHLGFFQEIRLDTIEEHLDLLMEKKYDIAVLKTLEATVVTSSWTYHLRAVNEFVIKSSDDRMIHLNLSVDGIPFINTSGDGVILSTPAGSTAYNLSAGGSVLHQTLAGYQITAMNPVRSKSYDSLPASMVLPAGALTTVFAAQKDRERLAIFEDGIRHTYTDVREIRIGIADTEIRRVVFRPNWYWRNLREKLF